jgi:hypothetical protein
MSDRFERLAQVELLDGWPSLKLDRWSIYAEILQDEPRDDRSEITGDKQIRRVFQIAAAEATGTAVSVADQRLAQFEILEHAELYAALAGISVASISEEQEWWAPNWSWFLTLRDLQGANPDRISDPSGADFVWLAPILLTAAADRLASFYGILVRGGAEVLKPRIVGRLSNSDKSVVTLLVEILRERGRRFLHGPDNDGRYLTLVDVDDDEVGRALAEIEKTWAEIGPTVRRRRRQEVSTAEQA